MVGLEEVVINNTMIAVVQNTSSKDQGPSISNRQIIQANSLLNSLDLVIECFDEKGKQNNINV